MDTYEEITRTIELLGTCEYDAVAFGALLGKIQTTIDRLNLEGYANLDAWVGELDQKIEEVLIRRLRAVLEVWASEFAKDGEAPVGETATRNKTTKVAKVRWLICFACADGRTADGRTQARDGAARDSDPEPSHLPRPSDRARARDVVPPTALVARDCVWPHANPELEVRDRTPSPEFLAERPQLHRSRTYPPPLQGRR